jgi:hypothetical protein
MNKDKEKGWSESAEYNQCFDENGYPNEKLQPFIDELLETARKEREENIKDDYIQWVLASTHERPYKGRTPFARWRQLAEAEDMKGWQ